MPGWRHHRINRKALIMNKEQERILALAGIFQSACLVDKIARTGMADADAVETSIFSIFQTESEDIESVFHDASHLRTGLLCLAKQMTEQNAERIDITRYALQLMQLAVKLTKKTTNVKKIANGIDVAKARTEAFGMTHTNIMSQLADLYVEQISPLSRKIMVNGEPLHLNNPDNVYKIRALLLAGIRSAWLWQQLGGKRYHMVFSRRKIHKTVTQLLDSV